MRLVSQNRRDVLLLGVIPTLAALSIATIILIERLQLDPAGISANYVLRYSGQEPVFAWMPAFGIFTIFHVIGLVILDADKTKSPGFRYIVVPLLAVILLMVAVYILGYRYGWLFLTPVGSTSVASKSITKLYSTASIPGL